MAVFTKTRIGWFGEEIVDAVVDVATSVWDASVDVFEALPGGAQVSKGLTDLVNGPLRDFAKTTYGKIVLRAIATFWYGPLAWSPVGPQLATLVWTFPGLLRGERFDEAWLLEFKWRAETAAQLLGGDVILAQFGDELAKAVTALGNEVGIGNLATMTFGELAARLGIREDVAAFALDLWNRTGPPGREAFDVATGKRWAPSKASIYSTANSRITSPKPVNRTLAIASKGPAVSSAIPKATAPTPIFAAATPDTPAKRSGDVLLGVTVVAAVGALVWFYRK